MIEHDDILPVLPRILKRTAAVTFLICLLSGLPAALFYTLGERAGRGGSYVAGYQQGKLDRETEMVRIISALQTTLAPIKVDDDMDCQTLSLIAARAGALTGVTSVAFAVGLSTAPVAP